MANPLFSQSQVESILGLQPGQATGGYAQNLINSDPAMAAKYNAAVTAATSAPPAQGAGVMPVLSEPLHQFERSALTEMANPPAYGQGSMTMANQYLQQLLSQRAVNPQAEQFMTQAGQFTQQGAAPITMQDIEAIRNPYAQALNDRLTEQGMQARQAILANQGTRGGRSFGDTAQGTREGFLDAELQRGRNDINFNTYESSLGQLQDMRNRSMNAGGQFGNLASGAQNITNSGFNNQINAATNLFDAGSNLTNVGRTVNQDRLGAGQYIRNYNQGVNDLVQSNILAGQADEAARLENVLKLLGQFQSGVSTGGMVAAPGSMTTLGGAATGAGALLNYYTNQQRQNVQQQPVYGPSLPTNYVN